MALYNIMRKNKVTGEISFWSHNKNEWLKATSNICRNILTDEDAEFEIRNLTERYGTDFYFLKALNTIKQRTCKISHYSDETGTNRDLENEIQKGFTIGNGKVLYWMMIWHGSGNVTVFSSDDCSRRWISGDTQITIHFNN